ncbi:DUF4748 domain-containing protein [Heterodontus francisci]|uniref:DUF4748 domain-containing protein n=1 Tax=Heterodontus francisci TaxID=7792 RepID=UPI00355BA355
MSDVRGCMLGRRRTKMAAGWRNGSWVKGWWSFCLVKLTAPATGAVLPVQNRVASVVPQSIKSIHCNHSNRPVLRAEETPEGPISRRPEYIPQRKAKNPMGKVGLAWLIGLPSGIITFLLAKREVDKNRLKQLKVRQRMKNANEGDYQSDRYQRGLGEREGQIVTPQEAMDRP